MFSNVDVTERRVEDLMADVREIRDAAMKDSLSDGATELSSSAFRLALRVPKG